MKSKKAEEIKEVIDDHLEDLRQKRKRTALATNLSAKDKKERDLVFYYAIQSIEKLKIRLLGVYDDKRRKI